MANKMEGWSELDRALGQLPKATARSVLQRVLKKRAEPIRQAWREMAPVQVENGGQYRDSIIVGPSSKLTARQKKDAKREGRHFAEIHVGTADPAGQQQEFGNVNHPAQPSGRPAWEQEKDKALAGIGEDLGAEIERAAKRLAKKQAKLGG